MNQPGRIWNVRLAGVACVLSTIVLAGCPTKPNVLTGVSLGVGESPGLDRQLLFVLQGTGTCGSVNVEWGDGTTQMGVVPVPGQRIEFETSNIESRRLSHSFTGWGGGKTVTVTAASGCEGTARLRFNAPPADKKIAFAQPGTGTSMCATPTPALPPMIPRMLVHVKTIPALAPHGRGINFGCFAGGCVYDSDGKPNSVAAAPFPFPGLREYSLVLRVGSQVVQGGTDERFTTTASGALEFCLNDGDNNLTNNIGGYEIHISVDQLGT